VLIISGKKIDVMQIVGAVQAPDAGAIAIFCGTVRNHSNDRIVVKLNYEANIELAKTVLNDIAEESKKTFDVIKVAVHHRTGMLEVGDTSVVIAVSSAHRKPAFRACEFILESIKSKLPVWKKEYFTDGASWVEGIPVK